VIRRLFRVRRVDIRVAALHWGVPRLRSWLVVMSISTCALGAGGFAWPTRVERVERQLTTGDFSARRAAMTELSTFPRGVAARLVERALGDESPGVRLMAADLAVRWRLPLQARVMSWLADTDVSLRLAAVRILAIHPSGASVDVLVRALGDVDPRLRLAAASALGGARNPAAVPALIRALQDPKAEVRWQAARALGRLGDDRAVLPLVAGIGDLEPKVRRAVVASIGALASPDRLGVLLPALHDEDAGVRALAARGVTRLHDDVTVASLSALLAEERHPTVLEAVAVSLLRTGSDDAIEALVSGLHGLHGPGKGAVIQELRANTKKALGPLTRCLTDAPSGAATDCAEAIGGGPPGTASVLIAAAARGAISRQVAADALGRTMEPAAVGWLLEVVSQGDTGEFQAAAGALSALLDADVGRGFSVEPLTALLKQSDLDQGRLLSLIDLLGKTRSERAVGILLRYSQSEPSSELALFAVRALGYVESNLQCEGLASLLGSESSRMRKAAAFSLYRRSCPGVATVLLDRMRLLGSSARSAALLALSGALSTADEPRVIARVERLMTAVDGAERDALIEGLARGGAPAARPWLERLSAVGSVADRAKLAEAVSPRWAPRVWLSRLIRDREPSVRANAVWSAGRLAGPEILPILFGSLKDADPAVAANAAIAVGRIAARSHVDVHRVLCRLLDHARAAVRASATNGLAISHRRCEDGKERELLSSDPSRTVREAAARLISTTEHGEADRLVLDDCRNNETSASVLRACAPPEATRPRSSTPLLVFVTPAGQIRPVPRAAFGLRLPNGWTRYGTCDRRGAVFESEAESGEVQLQTPAVLLD